MRYVITNQKQKVTADASSFHRTGEHTVFYFSGGLSIPHEKRTNKQTNKQVKVIMHEFQNSERRPLTNCSISASRQNAVSTPCRETESGYFQLFPKTDIDATVTESMQITSH